MGSVESRGTMAYVVEDQEQLDECLRHGDKKFEIQLNGPGQFDLSHGKVKAGFDTKVSATGKSTVRASDFTQVILKEQSIGFLSGSAKAWAGDNTQVGAEGTSSVTAFGESTVAARGNARVLASEKSWIIAREKSRVSAVGKDVLVIAMDEADVVITEGAQCEASGGTVEVREFSVGFCLEGSTMIAMPGATVYDLGGKVVEAGGAIIRDKTQSEQPRREALTKVNTRGFAF